MTNVSEIEIIRKILKSQYSNSLDFAGLMIKPNLFFKTDIFVDMHQCFK